MLDRRQAEVIADSMLAPGRQELAAIRARKQARAEAADRTRRRSRFVLIGLAVTGSAGYVLQGEIFPAGLLGMAIGALVGLLLVPHEALHDRTSQTDGSAPGQ